MKQLVGIQCYCFQCDSTKYAIGLENVSIFVVSILWQNKHRNRFKKKWWNRHPRSRADFFFHSHDDAIEILIHSQQQPPKNSQHQKRNIFSFILSKAFRYTGLSPCFIHNNINIKKHRTKKQSKQITVTRLFPFFPLLTISGYAVIFSFSLCLCLSFYFVFLFLNKNFCFSVGNLYTQ